MKVSIIGIGRVGSTLAYTLSIRDACSEIVLVNRNHHIASGDALDLQHAQSFVDAPAKIRAGLIEDTRDSDIIAYCASAPMQPEFSTRLSLGKDNVALIKEHLPPLAELSPKAVLVMVTNPVDILTWYAIQFTGFPPERVIGTGTLIDSARFRAMLSKEVGIHPDDLRAYILGEHGESQFPFMSLALAGGEHIKDSDYRREVFHEAMGAGIQIFREKGYTNYAIAMATTVIIESIALDERRTMPLSTMIDGYQGVSGVCLSVPVVVGRPGITRVFQPELNEAEAAAFQNSAATVRQAIEESAPAEGGGRELERN